MKKIFCMIVLLLMIFIVSKENNKIIVLNNNYYLEGNMNQTAAEYLKLKSNGKNITNYTDGNIHEMYTFEHDSTAQTSSLTDYRYIGDNPYNYVKFNCDDDGNNCEIWRIIGVFSVDDGLGNVEQRIKLIRESSIVNDFWNNISDNNDWTTASLQKFLNGRYYNNFEVALTNEDGLKTSARNLIDDAVFYLGAGIYDQAEHYGSTEDIYVWERGESLCGACGSDTSKLKWIGKVGLMYPSDNFYTYSKGVDDICYNDPCDCYDVAFNPATGDYDLEKEKPGFPKTGWIYNSNNLQEQMSANGTWFLSPSDESSDNYSFVFNLISEGFLSQNAVIGFSPNGVRPVVYLKSNVKISGGTGELGNEYTFEEIIPESSNDSRNYIIGQSVTYNNTEYCVINNSKKSDDYVTLIKKEPLTYDELVTYKGNLDITNFQSSNGIGLLKYYFSDNCKPPNKASECTNDYNSSFVKTILNNWSNSFTNDLKEINGYKVRLLNFDDIFENLGYDKVRIVTEDFYKKTDAVPSCIYSSNYSYWTMIKKEDFNFVMYVIGENGDLNDSPVYNNYAVRPVINLKKCVIDNSCSNEMINSDNSNIINSSKNNDNKTIVNVENTLKVISTVLLIVSILLIIGGMSILSYNYIKSKRERR